ncbi:MAG: hypothetical protein KGS48_05540 [Bacteroidetes bacterium]|nr:hypothetical protein [Bacteroidota bacterium]
MHKHTWLILICFCTLGTLQSQSIYIVMQEDSNVSEWAIYKLDLATCTYCPIIEPDDYSFFGLDFIVLPNGKILTHTNSLNLVVLESPPSTNIVWQGSNNIYNAFIVGPNGVVYLISNTGLATFDPVTYTITQIGSWPPSFSNYFLEDMYIYNGQVYAAGTDLVNGGIVSVQIDLSNPSNSTLVGPTPLITSVGGTYNNTQGVFYIEFEQAPYMDLKFYNPVTGSSELVCDLPENAYIWSIDILPAGLPSYPCLCVTSAGYLGNQSYSYCINANAIIPPATQTELDNNDLLRYILFSNPGDPLGSIIATSDTPTFPFNPNTMQAGITYYIAAIAGNDINGILDLSDPCLDISNAVQVVWRPLPTTTFTVANPNVCAGACTVVTANFTGTAPFTLSYSTTGSGSATQTFSGNSGTFQICPPPGTTPGNLIVQATKIVDAWCTCE